MNSVKRDYSEKRNFIRMKIDTPATIELSDAEDHYAGICRDLSGGGMLVELDTAIPIGTKLEVKIASAHGHAPMLKARVQVARVVAQPSLAAHTCMLGLEILELM